MPAVVCGCRRREREASKETQEAGKEIHHEQYPTTA